MHDTQSAQHRTPLKEGPRRTPTETSHRVAHFGNLTTRDKVTGLECWLRVRIPGRAPTATRRNKQITVYGIPNSLCKRDTAVPLPAVPGHFFNVQRPPKW
jgi:hypothetical protein